MYALASPVQEDGQPVASDRDRAENHAGVIIGANQPPQLHELALWSAARDEVMNFEWRAQPDPDEPDPPTYRVTGIRRSANTLFAIVHSNHHDRQEDHLMGEIREKVFYSRVEVGLRVKNVPLMLRWSSFSCANLSINHDMLRANLKHYNDIVRCVADSKAKRDRIHWEMSCD